jgi:hypothetical protein
MAPTAEIDVARLLSCTVPARSAGTRTRPFDETRRNGAIRNRTSRWIGRIGGKSRAMFAVTAGNPARGEHRHDTIPVAACQGERTHCQPVSDRCLTGIRSRSASAGAAAKRVDPGCAAD